MLYVFCSSFRISYMKLDVINLRIFFFPNIDNEYYNVPPKYSFDSISQIVICCFPFSFAYLDVGYLVSNIRRLLRKHSVCNFLFNSIVQRALKTNNCRLLLTKVYILLRSSILTSCHFFPFHASSKIPPCL